MDRNDLKRYLQSQGIPVLYVLDDDLTPGSLLVYLISDYGRQVVTQAVAALNRLPGLVEIVIDRGTWILKVVPASEELGPVSEAEYVD